MVSDYTNEVETLVEMTGFCIGDAEEHATIDMQWHQYDHQGRLLVRPYIRMRIRKGDWVSAWVDAEQISTTVKIMQDKRERLQKRKLEVPSKDVL